MEPLTNYNMKGYNFTIWFFRIVVFIITISIVLICVLRINETVSIKEGEIVSGNPQADYKAPFEAQILNIAVKEGQAVKKGDTLINLQNLEYAEQYAKTKTEIEYLGKKIASLGVLEGAVYKKKNAIDQTSAITARRYQLDINRLVNDMKSLDEQYSYQKERLSTANEKYKGDSILYQKEMLSKYELNNTKDANLAVKENLATMQSQRIKQSSEKNLAYNNFTREQNTLLLTKVQLEENAQSIVQAKNDFESQLIQAKEALQKLEKELGKQTLVAETSGIVNYLFNTRQASNMISKGELLLSIVPEAISYYAKVFIPEKDMPYMKAGLQAQLKLDAYHNFQYGLMDGKVTYVAERKENDKFYALVALAESPNFKLKSGYTVYGEIVIDRMPLYRYFIKKLFKNFSPS